MDYYSILSRRRRNAILLISLGTILLLLIDLTVGNYELRLLDFIQTLIKGENVPTDKIIMFKIRLPKTLTCLGVGASLGLSGYYMQAILKNPIASPFTLGISSASSCGAALSILTGFPFVNPAINIPLSAVLFSLLCTFFMLFALIKKQLGSKLMILFGVALNFFFLAFQSLLQYSANEKQSQKIVHWIFGTVSRANWSGTLITFVIFILLFTVTYRKSWDLNVLGLSDERARGMGLDVNKTRKVFFFCSSIITAVAISYVGTIGFIGLLAPHFARWFVGNDSRYAAPTSAIFGGLILLLASVIAKTAISGGLLPVGIITNLVGVPFMMMIVFKRRGL